jgi:hypothetical protein
MPKVRRRDGTEGGKMTGWKCSKCGFENEFPKEQIEKMQASMIKMLAFMPSALLFASLKALGWLFIGIAALKFVNII